MQIKLYINKTCSNSNCRNKQIVFVKQMFSKLIVYCEVCCTVYDVSRKDFTEEEIGNIGTCMGVFVKQIEDFLAMAGEKQ